MGIPEKGIEEVGMEGSVGGNGVAKNSMIEGPGVASAACVSTASVEARVMLLSTTSVGFIVGVDVKPLQDVNITTIRNKRIITLPIIFTFPWPLIFLNETPNGPR